jgi:hypothetical protein
MYINDLLMFFSSTKKHIEHVKLMLQRLKKFNLYLKFNKCSFHVFHVNFLDFRINLNEITIQTNKIVVVKDWSKFKSHKNVQVFIDFANFYKRFVHAFSKVSAELFSLLKRSDKSKFKFKFVMISEAKCYVIVCKKRFLLTKETYLVFCRSRASWRQVRHAFDVCYSHRMIHRAR